MLSFILTFFLTPFLYSSLIFIFSDLPSLIQILSLNLSANPSSIQSPTLSPSPQPSLIASLPVPPRQSATHREATPGLEGQGNVAELLSQGQKVQVHSWQVRFSLWGKVF